MKFLISKFVIMSTDMQDVIKSNHSSVKVNFGTDNENVEYTDNSNDSEKLPEVKKDKNES